MLPGDPAAIVLGTGARPDTLAALRAQMGLDRPLPAQFIGWLADLARGRLGVSHTYGTPVADLIAPRLALTLPLAGLAIVLTVLIALPAGVLAAARRGRATDTVTMTAAQIGIAVPNFWLGLLLILTFAVALPWLPAGGFPGWEAGAGPALRALLLPAVALALPQAAILARVTRTAVLETLAAPYVRTARAKGASQAAALWRHAVPNALLPVLTVLGLQIAFLLAGTIIIESVFSLAGLGRLVFQAIAQRDLPVVQDMTVLLAGVVILVNHAVDAAHVALDPRLRRP